MSPPASPPVTRFAPSPSGFLHLGNARTALTSVLHGPELAPLPALIPPNEVQARLERARRLAT